MRRVWIGLLMIALLCAFTFTQVNGAELVNADDGEFEDDVTVTSPPPGIPLQTEKKASKSLQQDNDYYDADEFEGIEKIAKPVIEEEEEEEEKTQENIEKNPPLKPRFGLMEISYITFILLFLGNYIVGKRANDNLATVWGQCFQNLFASNFVKFGEANKFIIQKESAYTFTVTASGGRARCAGAVFTLDLNKRHDLSSYLFNIISPHKDTLTIDVAMHPNQPFCFGLAKKKEVKSFLKTYKEIADFAPTPRVLPRLPNYVIHTDSNEIVETVLPKEIIDILNQNEAYFTSVSYSDVSEAFIGYKTMLRIVYRLPPMADMKKLTDLMRVAFTFIDSFASIQLNKSVVMKNEGMRKKLVVAEKSDHEVRQEVAQKKKLDRAIAERVAYEKMTPEQQRKHEEKEEKKRIKNKMGRVKVVHS